MILFPHAKINIGLNILSKIKDGYHNISSVFYPVKQCYDVLEITEQQHFYFVKSGIKIPDGENLCEKAFHLLKKDFSFANVETKQIDYDTDMMEIYKQTSLLIRLTKHDGFSSMVLEALSLGRNVIWTYKIPHCFQTEAEREKLLNLFNKARKREYNSSGAHRVRNNFNYSNFINKLESLYVNPNYKFKPIVIK